MTTEELLEHAERVKQAAMYRPLQPPLLSDNMRVLFDAWRNAPTVYPTSKPGILPGCGCYQGRACSNVACPHAGTVTC